MPGDPFIMHDVMTLDFSRIAQDLQVRRTQVENVVGLLDEGNTVPFITRYRKERTGGLDEEAIRQIQARVAHQRQLAERKQSILRSIETQGKLTDELRNAILAADTAKHLEDLYLPYKPKKRTLATTAQERGLGPLAEAVWERDPAAVNLAELLPTLVNPEKELNTPEEVLAGVQHILAERVAETAEVRAAVRRVLWESGKITAAKSEKLGPEQGEEFKDYFQFAESLRQIPPHRILALGRGEKDGALTIKLEWDAPAGLHAALKALAEQLQAEAERKQGQPTAGEGELLVPEGGYRSPHAAFLRTVVEDALGRLLLPSLEREVRRELTEEAEAHAVGVFARNLRRLLLQRPLWGRRVLAIDPGYRTGCKLAALDETGKLLEHGVIYPHGGKRTTPAAPPPPAAQPEAAPTTTTATASEGAAASGSPQVAPEQPPENVPTMAAVETPGADATRLASPVADATPPATGSTRKEEAKGKLFDFITRHNLNVVAIGNGSGCRETEELVADLIAEKLPELAYVIVNEAGASVYSASPVGREEFPDFDATLRGTISIGRRLQDPLSELVKIDPPSIGVGLYQHDVNPRQLRESLETVVESCVNQVGVDLNTASVPLLRHVAGLNQLVARELVEHRQRHGPFRSREQLLQVPGIGPARYVQAAGFLKIRGGEEPFDQTWIHPENYGLTRQLLAELGYDTEVLTDSSRQQELQAKLQGLTTEETAKRLEAGLPTLRDILDALVKPDRDPREDLPPPIFKKGVLKLEDLQPGMELKGTVLNVVDFGAFVDIGLKDSGLVHISQMANRFIKSPYEVVAVGDVVTVWVMNVDQSRRRVSLTMIKPGTERKPHERRPQERGQHPPQEGRRPPAQDQGPPRGRGPRPRGRRREPAVATATASGQSAETSASRGPAPRPAPPPPRRRHEGPRPKLSQEALEGKVPLRTFGELSALFAAKQKGERPPSPPPSEPGSVPDTAEPALAESGQANQPQETANAGPPS
jgi:uncharacterized protein